MWWGGNTQDGWGLNIVQRAGILFGVWYTYGPNGKATWYVLPNGTWTGTTDTGPLYGTTGSPCPGATYSSGQVVVTTVGSLSHNFSGANNAIMTYTVSATTQRKPVFRQPY